MKISSYHEGDRSEPLAQMILSAISHVVPVPRPADYFGVDLFAHLFAPSQKALRATGITVALQVKSNMDPIKLERPDNLCSLHALALPFFICVVDRSKRTASIYSTLFRFTAYWINSSARITFFPGGEAPYLRLLEADTHLEIGCGRPIAVASQDELDHEDCDRRGRARKTLSKTLEYWCRLESDAISWRATGIPISPCPPSDYVTNQQPSTVPNLSINLEHASLGPLLQAMGLSAFGFQALMEAVSRNGTVSSVDEKTIESMKLYAIDHARRLREYGDSLESTPRLGSPYIID